MYQRTGKSIYGQNLYQNRNNNSGNLNQNNINPNVNNNNFNYNNINNPYPPIHSSNSQNINRNYNNNIENFQKKKYDDIEIETFFYDGNNALSSKDMELKENLEVLTKQYNTTINNIKNNGKSSGEYFDNYQFNKIKSELKDLDSFFGVEYGKFIAQLFDITKEDSCLNEDYEKYKQRPDKTDQLFKDIIGKHKYDIVLEVNKNCNSQENINKIKNYIDSKTGKSSSNNNYSNNNDKDQDSFSLLNNKDSMRNNNNNSYNNNNNNYVDINFHEPEENYWKSIKNPKVHIKYNYKGNIKYKDVEENESAETLYYLAFDIKDTGEPKLKDKTGKELSLEYLESKKVKDVVSGIDPEIIIY